MGAEVLELPAIRTVPVEDQSRLYAALDDMEAYQWIVFTSPTGVGVFLKKCKSGKKIFGVWVRSGSLQSGKEPAASWKERGLYVDLMPKVYDGDSLGKRLQRSSQAGSGF